MGGVFMHINLMDVYLSLQFGNTALSEARDNNHNDVVQYLLQHQSKWKVETLALLDIVTLLIFF